MITLAIEVQNAGGETLARREDEGQVCLVYSAAYQPGDTLILTSSEEPVYLVLQLEDAMNPAFVYLAGQTYRFVIPFAEKKIAYSPKAFTGELHVLTARLATAAERAAYKNLALNVYDQHANTVCFPHASANVETRGESVFAARNAINGNVANDSHGPWPYESWGINQRADAELQVDFGRMVEIDQVVLTLRADFPHDNYWQQVTLHFSDGSRQVAQLVKTHRPQAIAIAPRRVEWVKLNELIKSDDPALFPALTQIEVFGREV